MHSVPVTSKRLNRLNGAILGLLPPWNLFPSSPWACGAVSKYSSQAKAPTFTKTTAFTTSPHQNYI
ncbi:MAG: hypothetical protein ACTS7D_01185 [Candidatus Hodgkinia cicadicola]